MYVIVLEYDAIEERETKELCYDGRSPYLCEYELQALEYLSILEENNPKCIYKIYQLIEVKNV